MNESKRSLEYLKNFSNALYLTSLMKTVTCTKSYMWYLFYHQISGVKFPEKLILYLFSQFFFWLLLILDTFDSYYFASHLSLVLLVKVLLIKKHVTLFFSL